MFSKKTYRETRWLEHLIAISTDEEGGVINERGDTATLHILPKEYPFFVLTVRPHPSVRDMMVREWQRPTYITMSHKDDCVACG